MSVLFWPMRFTALGVEGRLQALLLRLRGTVLAVDALDDLADLRLQLRVGRFHRRIDLRHLGMVLAVTLGELRLLTLHLGEVRLETLDVIVGENGRERLDGSGGLHRRELVVERLFVDALGARLDERAVQVGQTLDRDGRCPLGDRYRSVLLIELLERRLTGVEGFSLLGQPL